MNKIITYSNRLGIFGLVREGETEEAALERGKNFFQEVIEWDTRNLKKSNNKEYWLRYIRLGKDKRDHLQIETWAQYRARVRAA